MAKKPKVLHEPRIVVYDQEHWQLLRDYRIRAIGVMETLMQSGIHSFVYGSVARGDISRASDVDIVILQPVSSYRLELVLNPILHRELVQATPSMVLKGHIHLENDIVVSFPLFKLRPREEEFYKWGGWASLEQIRMGERVMGVDKRLLLIEPTKYGHVEHGVIGHEASVARRMGVSVDIASERVRVLTRRDSIGRTGVYLSRVVPPGTSFEAIAKMLEDSNPALRRTIHRRER